MPDDDENKRGHDMGTGNQRVYRIITILFLGAALVMLSKMASYIVANLPQQPVTQNVQLQLNEQHTAEAMFATESTAVNLTSTAWAATSAKWLSTIQAMQTEDHATEVAMTFHPATSTSFPPATPTASRTPALAFTLLPVEKTQTYIIKLTSIAHLNTMIAAVTRTAKAKPPTAVISTGTGLPTPTALPSTGGGCCSAGQLANWEAENLDQGRYLFNPPSEMVAGRKYRIELRIVRDNHVDSEIFYEATLGADLQGQGTPQVESLQVGNFMRAKLIGSDFEITSLNEDEQVILGKSYTQWAWDVTPKRSGNLDLNLTISVKIIYENEVGLNDYPVITKRIVVKVNPTYSMGNFVKDNWQWLMGAIILPVLPWIWKKMREGRENEEKEKRPKKKKK